MQAWIADDKAAPGQVAAVRRIAVVGAECVGKTTLCEALAHRLPGLWVPEYLREFCDRAGRTPRPEEQPDILHTQIEHESRLHQRAAAQGVRWLLCDSAPIVTALYSRMLFDDPSLIEPALQHHRQYWATLLLQPDLPWTPDRFLRDGPAVRNRYHAELTALLRSAGIEVHAIDGDGELRAQRACRLLAPGLL
jgi:nicotinamide riboside kinase